MVVHEWYMDGTWMVRGLKKTEFVHIRQRWGSFWYVFGSWTVRGWYVNGTWMVCGFDPKAVMKGPMRIILNIWVWGMPPDGQHLDMQAMLRNFANRVIRVRIAVHESRTGWSWSLFAFQT